MSVRAKLLLAAVVTSVFFSAFPQALAALSPPLPGTEVEYSDLSLGPGERLTFTRNMVTLTGSLTLSSNAVLTLVSTSLNVTPDGAIITVGPGASLILTDGSTFSDSPLDNDDGQPGDGSYTIGLAGGSTLSLMGSVIERSLGVQATDAMVKLESSLFVYNRGGIVLDGASSLAAVNSSFANNPSPALDVRGSSSADVRGLTQPTYQVASSATFMFSSFAAVKVVDVTGKPLQGAEWAIESPTGLVAGSPGFGGGAPLTEVDHEGYSSLLWTAVPNLIVKNGETTMPGAAARARYGTWTDVKFVSAGSTQVITFTAMPQGVRLLDVTQRAMLENMMMHDPMGGMGSMGSMGGMGDMMGPMMTQGPGSAWGDFNGDGKMDAIVTAAPETDEMMLMEMGMTPESYPGPALFLGNGDGSFTHLMTSGLEIATGATGVSAADFDGDGDLDLFVARYGATGMAMHDPVTMETEVMSGMPLKSMIFRNDGTGMFADASSAVMFDMPARHTVGGVWGDYNRDGCLDLYAVNMGELVIPMEGMDGMGGMGSMGGMEGMDHGMGMSYIRNEPNVLYKNNCDGTFMDVTSAVGGVTGQTSEGSGVFQSLVMDEAEMYWYGNLTMLSPAGSGISYTALWIDYNEDGWPDLMVANDFGVSPLYKNNGDGTFTLWTEQAGLAKLGSAMGFAAADFNRDGHIDVFQSNFNQDFLWMNSGEGAFTDRAMEFGVADMSVGWGVAAPDINLDGYPDLAVATGYMSMMMKASERSVLYINDGGRRFWDVSASSGFDDPAQGISVAVADVDKDGRPDLFLGNTNASNRLFLNRENGGGFVKLELRGLVSNSFGLGAEVSAVVGGKPYRSVLGAGGEYASSGEPALWIGLGMDSFARRVTIMWPSGVVQALGDLKAGSMLVVREAPSIAVDAGPDGDANTSSEVMMHGALRGGMLPSATYKWDFHGPTFTTTIPGKDVMWAPDVPGVYAVEFVVLDRFGQVFGSDFCIMKVKDTSMPVIGAAPPAKITASAPAKFSAMGTVDNDPAFATGATYEWVFRNGAMDVKATGMEPSVLLPAPGVWNVTIKVTDPSGNVAYKSFDARVTGTAPARITPEMVVAALGFTSLTILGIGVAARQIWFSPVALRRRKELELAESGEERPALVADVAAPALAPDALKSAFQEE